MNVHRAPHATAIATPDGMTTAASINEALRMTRDATRAAVALLNAACLIHSAVGLPDYTANAVRISAAAALEGAAERIRAHPGG